MFQCSFDGTMRQKKKICIHQTPFKAIFVAPRQGFLSFMAWNNDSIPLIVTATCSSILLMFASWRRPKSYHSIHKHLPCNHLNWKFHHCKIALNLQQCTTQDVAISYPCPIFATLNIPKSWLDETFEKIQYTLQQQGNYHRNSIHLESLD